MKIFNWIKLFFSNTFKVILPFITKFIQAEAAGLTPIVLETIEAIASLPNFDKMTWAEKLGEAIVKIEAKAIEIGKTFTKTEIISQIQVLVTKKEDESNK